MAYKRSDLDEICERWLARIEQADKREKQWRDAAEQAETAYLCDEGENGLGDVPDFNILHSNVETIIPAIYNSTPNPDIRPRHGNNDQIAKEISDALERAIATQIDDDKLTAEIEALAQDIEVAGRGVTRLKFDAVIGEDGSVTDEEVIFENISWRDYREGPAKRWADVPWVAYRHQISQDQLEDMTDDEVAETYKGEAPETESEKLDIDLWEIWDKETRKVYFVTDQTSRVIRIEDDPLGLDGFFPQPNPVVPIKGTGRRIPVCPYSVYRKLATELDMVTRRINGIMRGMKVRGIIAADAEVAEVIADLGDNEIGTVGNVEGLIAQGGLERAVMWWPVDKAIMVLSQLYQQREAIKAEIYEITGLSDIIRGATDPVETAKAQQIKTQWGSQRLKRKQRMIQSHVRDLFKLAAEIMVRHFSVQGVARAAGVQVTRELSDAVNVRSLDNFRIDVESDSTIASDLAAQRGEMSEFLNSTGGFFQIMAPLVGQNPELAGPTAEIFAAFTRTFRLGKSAEDAIDQMSQTARQSAGRQKPDPAAEAQKFEMQAKQAEIQIKAQEAQARMQEAQARAAEAQAKAQLAGQTLAIEGQKLQVQAVKDRFDIAIRAKQLGLAVNEHELAAQKAEIDAMMKIEEMDMEREQRRPVAFG